MPTRSPAHLGFSFLLIGSSCVGSVFSLSVIESSQLGSMLFLHSYSCLGLVLPALDFLHLEFSSPLRGHTYFGFLFLVFGMTKPASQLSVLDFVTTAFSVSLRSPARLGSSLLVLDFAHVDSPVLVRSFVHPGLVASTLGVARLGFIFSLLVVDYTFSDSLLSARSMLWLEPTLSVLDFLHPDLSMSPQSFAYMGSGMLALDFLHMGSLASLRSHIYPGSITPAFGMSRAGFVFPLSVIECARLGPFSSVHSLACSDLAVLAFDLLHLGFHIPLKSSSCPGSIVSVSGASEWRNDLQ